jgi:protein SPT2
MRTVLGGGKVDLKRKMGKNGMSNGKDELRALCPDRDTRDRRTIDEIQRDIVNARPVDLSKIHTQVDRERHGKRNTASGSRSSSPVKGIIKPSKTKPPPIPSSARPIKSPHNLPPSAKPRRARSPSSSSTTSSRSQSSIPNPRKRSKYPPDEPSQYEISKQIQDMFRRPDRPPPGRVVYSDEESDGDMEAGLSDVEAEERRAAVLARREDERAEKEEREHRERKERLRREREKGGKVK